jgi:hypothetical protein
MMADDDYNAGIIDVMVASPTISMNACRRCAGDKFDHHPRKKF